MELEKYSQKELIAEVERLNKELVRLNSEQRNNSATVKTLIAKISHELKTPLNSIIGFGELIRYKTNDEKIIDYSKNILISSEHMLALVQDIIDVTNTQYKPLELNYSIFSPSKVIDEVINSFNNKNIKTVLIDLKICADYIRFKQLVYNLISNAIKFNNNTNIEIITYVEDNNFCFEISDSGDGIKTEDCERIFELFVQVSEDSEKQKKGSGIGLALCKAIVDAHKGEIKAVSDIGQGATFIFKIPIEFIDN